MTKRNGLIRIKLEDVLPNPFRRTDRYPIRQEKVLALRESIGKTGFWDNIVARRSPTDSSKVEIAYGHHRIAALHAEFTPSHEIGLILRELDDETMLAMMIRENGEEYGADALILMETIEATVQAYADGVIEFETIGDRVKHSDIRYAPSFQRDPMGTSGHRPYTVVTLGKFLGWMSEPRRTEPQEKLYTGLSALSYIEQGLAKKEDFEGLSPTALKVEIGKLGKKLRPQIAAAKHRHVARGHEAKAQEATSEVVAERHRALARTEYQKAEEVVTTKRALPDINDYAPRLATRISGILEEGSDGRVAELKTLLANLEHVEPAIRADIVRTLLLVARRATDFADQFQRDALTKQRRLELVSSQG